MGRRKKQHERCERCALHTEDCLCAWRAPLAIDTHVAMVLHRREVKKPTNTGRLSLLALTNHSLFVRGNPSAPAELEALVTPERRVCVLFPREDATPLTAAWRAADTRPVTLIVPDGTWGQARRAMLREPVLRDAEAVVPPSGPPTRYRLRREHVLGGLATFEAVARALGVIESPEVQHELELWFEAFVSRSLARKPPASETLT